jgi:hypothetical protein
MVWITSNIPKNHILLVPQIEIQSKSYAKRNQSSFAVKNQWNEVSNPQENSLFNEVQKQLKTTWG